MAKRKRARRSTPIQGSAVPAARRVVSGWVLVVVLAPLLLYGRTVGFGYVQADDTDLVRDNQAFLGNLANAPAAFEQSYFAVAGQADPQAYYRPIVVLSLMLNARMGGPNPAVYHATNVVLHAVAVLLLFLLLRRLGGGPTASGLAALLFAVHPAHVQAVAWIVGRNDILMTILGISSLLSLLSLIQRPRRLALALHLGSFVVALFTKETAVLLVVLFLLVVWRQTGALTWLRQHWALPLGWTVATGVWYAARSSVLAAQAPPGLEPSNVVRVVLENLPQIVLYAGKALFPVRPSIMPGVDAAGLALGMVALVLLTYALVKLMKPPTALLAGVWFLLFLLPVLVIPGLPAYEHRLYFPLVGLAVGLAEVATDRAWHLGGRASGVVAAGVVVAFAGVAYRHSGVFRDPTSYWGSATTGTPYAPIALVNLGYLAEEQGRPEEAERQYREALALDPATPKASNNLGTILARRGQYPEARQLFEREIANHPENFEALFNLGLTYKVTGNPDRAVEYWDRSIRTNPRFRPPYDELIAYFESRGDDQRAAFYRARLAEALGSPE